MAKLCGVTEGAIRGFIRRLQKTYKKVGTEVRTNYESEIYNLLKDKVIFLEELRTIGSHPLQQGGP
ncbi:hypothetical protein TI05_16650, partial [Achromatium sp. WMS3]